jgi:hypothetical protein
MWHRWGEAVRAGLLGGATLAVAGCSSLVPDDMSQFRAPTFDVSAFQFRDWNSFARSQATTRQVSANDYVDGSGHCAGAAPMAPAGPDPSAQPGPGPVGPGVAGSSGGIGLDMTECEVVTTAGPPQTIDIGSNERGERNVIMTYTTADRSGTYRFVGGRLVSLERGPEPPPPPPQAQKKPTKKQAKKQPPPPPNT